MSQRRNHKGNRYNELNDNDNIKIVGKYLKLFIEVIDSFIYWYKIKNLKSMV